MSSQSFPKTLNAVRSFLLRSDNFESSTESCFTSSILQMDVVSRVQTLKKFLPLSLSLSPSIKDDISILWFQDFFKREYPGSNIFLSLKLSEL